MATAIPPARATRAPGAHRLAAPDASPAAPQMTLRDRARSLPAAAATQDGPPPVVGGSARGAADPASAVQSAAASALQGAPPLTAVQPDSEAAAASTTSTPEATPVGAQEATSPAPPQAALGAGTAALSVAAAQAAPGPVAQLAPPVGSADWAPSLAQQIVRLPGGGEVELHLNPVELGPLQVKVSVVEGHAQVQFVAEHAAVRHALEAALPQLRSSLAESGISLGQASVGAGAGEQRAGHAHRTGRGPGEPAAAGNERQPSKPLAAAVRSARSGAVDTFA